MILSMQYINIKLLSIINRKPLQLQQPQLLNLLLASQRLYDELVVVVAIHHVLFD